MSVVLVCLAALTECAYLRNISFRPSTLPSRNRYKLCTAVINSGEDKRLSKTVDAVGKRAWVRPIAESNIVPANRPSVAEYCKEEAN